MRIVLSDRAADATADAPAEVQKACYKQLRFLARSIGHPSLHAKKYDEAQDIRQARVNKSWRFYFKIGRHLLDHGCHRSSIFRMAPRLPLDQSQPWLPEWPGRPAAQDDPADILSHADNRRLIRVHSRSFAAHSTLHSFSTFKTGDLLEVTDIAGHDSKAELQGSRTNQEVFEGPWSRLGRPS